MDRLYLNIIPSELDEIIISYLNEPDDVKNIGELLEVQINWGTVSYLNLGKFYNINFAEYLRYLGITKLRRSLNLNLSLDELLHIEELNLNQIQLTELPKEIGNLVNLKILNLGDNILENIPKEIGNLINLNKLNLNNNRLSQLPNEIFLLKKL
jgi:Leucine-rich repeat (LRR) protein